MKPQFVSTFLISFISGVAAGSMYSFSSSVIFTGAVVATVLVALGLLVSRPAGILILCCALGVSVGLWRAGSSFTGNEFARLFGQPYESEGIVATDPITSEKNGRLSQQLTLLPDGHSQFVRAQPYMAIPDIRKGDRVWIRGQLELPENFNEDFDYVGYLQRWQVYAVLKKPRVIVLKRAANNWRTPLLALRRYVVRKAAAFPESEGSLIVGMLIGQRQNIPEDVSKAFQRTGLTHIVAVSGFNMTIIATACAGLVWYLGRRTTNLLTIAIVFGFTVVTGASSAVVRAAIMAVMQASAQLLGRQYASLHTLLLVASLMIFHNPRVLLWDVGFQLSIAATFGVLIAFRIKPPASPTSFLSDLLRPTFGAIATTAPIIAFHFKTFSVIAPLANLLVLPLVPWIMLFGALTILPIIGSWFVLPTQMLTSLVLFITVKLSAISFASIDLTMPLWLIAAYYSALILYFKMRLQKSKKHDRIEKIII